jgi:hypothetical protein
MMRFVGEDIECTQYFERVALTENRVGLRL